MADLLFFNKFFSGYKVVYGNVKIFRHFNKQVEGGLPLAVFVVGDRLSRNIEVGRDLKLIKPFASSYFF